MLNISESYTAIRKWVRRQKLRTQHNTTLDAYRKGLFQLKGSIGIGDALEEGILDPQYLHGPYLMRMMPYLDERVWNAWNESSQHRLEAYTYFYDCNAEQLERRFSSIYQTLLPFEAMIEIANQSDSVPLLRWLHELNNPWRPIEWQPAQLLGEHGRVSQWALNTFDTLGISQSHAESLAIHFLCDAQNSPPQNSQQIDWMHSVGKKAFTVAGWSNSRGKQKIMRTHLTRVLDTLLPPEQWNWKRRWEEIGKNMPLAISISSKDSAQARLSACQGAMMAALLHEAPISIQMILCGFKRAHHPDEPSEGNPDAQFIRNHFFAEDPPGAAVSPILSAAFLFIESVDPDVEVGFMLDQLTRDPNATIETFSLDSIAL